MSQYYEYLDGSAKAEPFSPFGADDNWIISNDDLVLNDGIFLSLPLSLIQSENHTQNEQVQIEDYTLEFDSSIETAYSPLSPENVKTGQLVPTIKTEDVFLTSPYSPVETLSGSSSPNDKSSRAQIATKLLNDLDEYKEEPFSDWLEEKINLPIFDEFPVAKEPVQDTQSLLLEFESVCGSYNAPQLTHLTPPQSPPEIQYQQSVPIQQTIPVLNNQYIWQSNSQLEPIVTPTDIDDLVLHAAQNIEPQYIIPVNENLPAFDNTYECLGKKNEVPMEQSFAPFTNNVYDPSYADESASLSPSSPSSSSCSTYGSSENDEDWSFPLSSLKSSKSKSSSRSKPYARGGDDRRSRKKEQNKNAATRYRQKKKDENEILMKEEKELQNKNADLFSKYTDIQREVTYLKSLLRDLFKAKGLLK